MHGPCGTTMSEGMEFPCVDRMVPLMVTDYYHIFLPFSRDLLYPTAMTTPAQEDVHTVNGVTVYVR